MVDLSIKFSRVRLILCRSGRINGFESADYAEGRAAFMQKRPPKYTGK